MLFSTLPFSIFSPLPFTLNYSLTARSGRHTTFASTLFLCRKCLKFPSTLQSMRFDSSGGANFRAYRFVENAPFGFWILACMEFHATVQPMGVDSSGASNFGTYLSLETILVGFLQLPSTPCNQKLLFFLPSKRKLSWALAGNFLAWQLQGQSFGQQPEITIFQFGIPLQILHFWAWQLSGKISRLGPAA